MHLRGILCSQDVGPVINLMSSVGVCYNGNRQIPTCSMYTSKIIHVCIVCPCVGLHFLVLLTDVFHTCHIELFNLYCNTCALCYNTWFGTCPVSMVPFPYWVLLYNRRDAKTYRGLYLPIYIVWFLYSHVFHQGLIQCSHFGLL